MAVQSFAMLANFRSRTTAGLESNDNATEISRCQAQSLRVTKRVIEVQFE